MNEENAEKVRGGKSVDMLHGPLLKKIILFALPIAASSMLQQLFNSAAPALFTLIGTVGFRVLWVYVIFPIWNSFPMLIIVYPISWVLTGVMVVGYYFSQRRAVLNVGRK